MFFGKKFQGENGKNELNVSEIKDGKKLGQPFRCDYYQNINGKDIVFEFNGNHHYQSPFKILTDWRKFEVLTNPKRNNLSKKFIIFKIPLKLLEELLVTMKKGCLCALCGAIPTPIQNILKYFGDEMKNDMVKDN